MADECCLLSQRMLPNTISRNSRPARGRRVSRAALQRVQSILQAANSSPASLNLVAPSRSVRRRRNRRMARLGGPDVSGSYVRPLGGDSFQGGVAAAYSRTMVTKEPVITRGARSMRIQHRELVLGSVSGSTGFTVQSTLSLNPGLSATFPWLAPQAVQWEQYSVHSLTAEWIPILATSSAGDVIISPNYDASDPAPTTETQAANNKDTVIDSVWKCLTVPLDVNAMMGLGPRRYVRQSAVAGDIKTFDVGKLFICTNNEAGSAAAGKLYLSYDIEFFTPQNDPSTSTQPLYTAFYSRNAAQTFTTGVAAAINYDVQVFDPLSLSNSSGVFTPPAGVYKIEANVSFNDSASEAFTTEIFLVKNGGTYTPGSATNGFISFAEINSAVGTSVRLNNSLSAVITMNGTDTMQINALLTGAAGTLTSIAGCCQLVVSLA